MPATNDEKPLDRRGIDLTDKQIDQMLACWADGQSALKLPFVVLAVIVTLPLTIAVAAAGTAALLFASARRRVGPDIESVLIDRPNA